MECETVHKCLRIKHVFFEGGFYIFIFFLYNIFSPYQRDILGSRELQAPLPSPPCGNPLATVVQRLDNAIHRINHYPADSAVCFVNTYTLDSDFSGG